MAMILVVHGAGDAVAAEECCRRLEAAGASTWTPSRDLDPAVDWNTAIRNVLDRCDALLLLTDDGHASASAIGTVDLALGRSKPCYLSVPVGASLDPQLMQRHWVMLVDAAADDLGPLVASVGASRSGPPEVPPAFAPPFASNYVRASDRDAPFRHLQGLAAWAIGVVAAGTIVGGLEALTGFRQVMLLFAGGGAAEAVGKAATLSDAFDIVQFFNALLLVLGAVTVLMWMWRAIKNLPALGVRDYPFKAGFAVGSFFIPFVNLYVPYKAMAALGRGSRPAPNPGDPDSWKRNRAPIASVLWTIFWLSSNILSGVEGRIAVASGASAAERVWANAYLMLGDGVATMLAGICLCLLISQITDWQRIRFDRLSQELQVESLAKTMRSSWSPGLALGGLLVLGTLVVGVPKVTLNPEKAEQWFSQSVPGTAFSALLPEVVKPEVDHEEGLTVTNWTAQPDVDAFSIFDYKLPTDADTSNDPDAAKAVVDELGKELGTPTGAVTDISLGSLKGFEVEANVEKPLVPPGSKGFVRGFASGAHIVVFMCILTEGEISEPNKDKFFASIHYGGGAAPSGSGS